MKQSVTCYFCSSDLKRHPSKSGLYFSNYDCKARWQRTTKPVTREWLYQKYIIEKQDCTQIAQLVNRNSKRVWEWLINEGIETRGRGTDGRVHFKRGVQSAFKGRKHTEAAKQLFREQKLKAKSCPAYVNGKHWLHVYKDRKPASWRGGITPERQAFYATPEWRIARATVWRRDKATCQKCGAKQNENRSLPFDVHHIVSFENVQLRAEPLNLILLCEPCHYWIHSRKNKSKQFIK
jgi:hypothetical protein